MSTDSTSKADLREISLCGELKLLTAWKILSLLFGMGISIVIAWHFSYKDAFSSFIGSLFSIFNLELTIWIWQGPFFIQPTAGKKNRLSPKKLAIKYLVLLGTTVTIAAVNLFNPIFFVIGTGNILIGLLFLPFLNRKYSNVLKD